MTTREQPDKSVKRYVMWYSLRLKACRRTRYFAISNIVGWVSSVRQNLYQQLANDKFPVCEVCGMTPEEPDHCEKLGRTRRRVRLIRKHWSSYRPPTLLGTYSWTP